MSDATTLKAVDLLDDTQPSATQTQPTSRPEEWKNAVSLYARMVSRVGIEPTTRRLRVRRGGVRWMPPLYFALGTSEFHVGCLPPRPPGSARVGVKSGVTLGMLLG